MILQQKTDDLENIALYSGLLRQHGFSAHSLNWGSIKSQQERFEVFLSIGNLEGKKILDVGCGLCDFYGFLKEKNIVTNYFGLDLTPIMIQKSKERYADIYCREGTLFDENNTFPDRSFDYVFASGIFYFRKVMPEIYMQKTIAEMYRICRLGVGFNTLSAWSSKKTEQEFYAEPEVTLSYCKSLTSKVILRHDYHPADFSIFLYKS